MGKIATLETTGADSAPLVRHQKSFVIEYADTDKMGVLHNARYQRLMEETLADWLRGIHCSFKWLEKHGFCLPVRHSQFKFTKPLFLEDEVLVKMTLQPRLGTPLVKISYDFYRGELRLSRAQVTHALCKYRKDPTHGNVTLVSLPSDWLYDRILRQPSAIESFASRGAEER